MIATLALDKSSEDETLSTARFAHRCQKLVNDISINERLDLPTVVKKLQEQNIELSKRLFQQENIIRQQDSLIKSRVGNSASCSQESFISHTPSQLHRQFRQDSNMDEQVLTGSMQHGYAAQAANSNQNNFQEHEDCRPFKYNIDSS